MKYYVMVEISYNDGTKDSLAIYSYDILDDALSSFHRNLGSWIQKENVAHILCMVIDYYGATIKNEFWDRPGEQR